MPTAQDQTWLTSYSLERMLPDPERAVHAWIERGAPERGAAHARLVNLVHLVPLGTAAAATVHIRRDLAEGAARNGLTPPQWATWLQAEGRLGHPDLVGRIAEQLSPCAEPVRSVGTPQAAALVASAAQVASARREVAALGPVHHEGGHLPPDVTPLG